MCIRRESAPGGPACQTHLMPEPSRGNEALHKTTQSTHVREEKTPDFGELPPTDAWLPTLSILACIKCVSFESSKRYPPHLVYCAVFPPITPVTYNSADIVASQSLMQNMQYCKRSNKTNKMNLRRHFKAFTYETRA
jgi:hypothetical protein